MTEAEMGCPRTPRGRCADPGRGACGATAARQRESSPGARGRVPAGKIPLPRGTTAPELPAAAAGGHPESEGVGAHEAAPFSADGVSVREPFPELLPAAQVARLVDRSPRTLRGWVKDGLIPRPLRIGRALLFRADDIRALLDP